jgi:glycosidase
MTFVGAPHVYYGDEIGMKGKKDPDNRRPFDWDWEQRPEAVEMRSLYRDLIHLRLASPVLQRGSFSFLPVGGDIVAYARELEGESMVVALNPGNIASQITLNRDYISLKTFGAIQRNMDAVLLPANSALVACLGKTGKAR